MNEKLDMPKHIGLFEKLSLGSLLIGVVVATATYKQMSLVADPFFIALIQIIVLGSTLLLILLISRKRSKVAKWILVMLWALGLVRYIPQLANFLDQGYVGILSICQLVMQAVGIYLLFTPESKKWFSEY